MIWLKGATMYEFQIGRLCVTWCHLDGDHWRWRPWRRLNIFIDRS